MTTFQDLQIIEARFDSDGYAGVRPERPFQNSTTAAELAEFLAPEGLSIRVDSAVIEPRVVGRLECTMVSEDSCEEAATVRVLLDVHPASTSRYRAKLRDGPVPTLYRR